MPQLPQYPIFIRRRRSRSKRSFVLPDGTVILSRAHVDKLWMRDTLSPLSKICYTSGQRIIPRGIRDSEMVAGSYPEVSPCLFIICLGDLLDFDRIINLICR